jgi:hypothetical protein
MTIRDGGNGRETEDDMRKRILEEMEVERKALEQELRDLKDKAEEVKVERECFSFDTMTGMMLKGRTF